MQPEPIPEFLGALPDTRPAAAKLTDVYQNESVAAAAPVNWVEKGETLWRKFPDQNQDGSSSCVAQTTKKLAGILLFLKENVYVPFSATHIYQRRSNRPGGGMIGVEAFDIWKQGVTLEDLAPSEKLTDAQMDGMKIETYKQRIGEIFSIKESVGIPNLGDMETVASTIQQTGKGVMVWFYFTSAEWSPFIPTILNPNLNQNTALRHSVTAVDFFLFGGKKYLLIEDSAHFGGLTRRLISEEFFHSRNLFIRYPMNFKFQNSTVPPLPPAPNKPHYTFSKILEYIPLDASNQISNKPKHLAQVADVISLQDILKYEGTYPTNVSSTGYYGAITAKAVYDFQIKRAVAPLAELDSVIPKGGRVGAKTVAVLNSLYAN